MTNTPQKTSASSPISGSPSPTATSSNANSQSPSCADHKWELERQLHEQYASNSNSHIKSFITFSTALFALFGFYGYLYAHTTDEFSRRVVQIILPSGNADVSVGVSPLYSLQSFILLALVVVVIFCFLTSLCIYLGYAERRDQIQLRIIRKKQGLDTVYSDPRGRCYMYYLASYYRFFYNILIVSQLFVIATAAVKCPPQCSSFVLFIYMLMVAFLVGSIHVKVKFFMKYKRLDVKYSSNRQKHTMNGSSQKTKNYVCISNGNTMECYSKKEKPFPTNNQEIEEFCGIEKANCFFYGWNYKSHSPKHKCIRFLFRFAFDIVVFAIALCIPLLAGAVTL